MRDEDFHKWIELNIEFGRRQREIYKAFRDCVEVVKFPKVPKWMETMVKALASDGYLRRFREEMEKK